MTYSGTKEENFMHLGTYPSICAPIHPCKWSSGMGSWGKGKGYASGGLNIK